MTSAVRKCMEIGFDNRKKPTMFLTNLFKPKQLDGIKVELQGRTVAGYYSVDVKLGTGGRYNSLDEYDKKEFTVPEYNDIASLSEEDVFKAQFGQTEYDKTAKILESINDGQVIFSDKQRRSEEKQASDGLFNGKIVLAGGNEIKFNKKTTHSISLTSAKWTSASSDPLAVIESAIELCITDGKISAPEWNIVFESKGINAFLNHEKVKNSSDWQKGIKRTDINMPVADTQGAMFHGRIACGSYIVNIWSYSEKYTVPKGFGYAKEGKECGYIPDGCALLVPMNPQFVRYYGAINNVNAPAKPGIGGVKLDLVKTEQLAYAYDVVANGSVTTKYGVKSRPLLIPANIDCFATIHDIV